MDAQWADPPVDTKGYDEKVTLRRNLRATFPNREMIVLVRPAVDETALQQLNTIPLNQLRSEFIKGLDAFRAIVAKHARPRRVGGVDMTGPCLAAWAALFVDAFNSGSLPEMRSALSLARSIRSRDLADLVCKQWTDNVGKWKTQIELLKVPTPWNEWSVQIESTTTQLQTQIAATQLEADVLAETTTRVLDLVQTDTTQLETQHCAAVQKLVHCDNMTPDGWRSVCTILDMVAPSQRGSAEQQLLTMARLWVPRWYV